MPQSNTLMDYGIAINFLGNYRKESEWLQTSTDKLHHSILSLQHLIIGGSIAYALKSMGESLFHTATDLEKVYAKLMTVFQDKNRVTEHFKHAREFVAENPMMNLEQVHEGTAMLAIQGLAKTSEQGNRNLKYLGDFAAGRGIKFEEGIQAVLSAINGNAQMLRNRGAGTSAQRAGVAREALGDAFDIDANKVRSKKDILTELNKVLDHGKKGTKEYGEALIKFVGIMEYGGMANASKTITGSLSGLHNLFTVLKLETVGITQQVGTLSNNIAGHLFKILGIFQTKLHEIEGIGQGFGHFLSDIFDMFVGNIDTGTNKIAGFIDRLAAWFKEYEKNVAPIILFLAIVKIQVEEFFGAFIKGFKTAFMPLVERGMMVWGVLAKVAEFLGLGANNAETLGKMLGLVLGYLAGIRAFKFIVSPLTGLIKEAVLLKDKFMAAKKALVEWDWFWSKLETGEIAIRKFVAAMRDGTIVTKLQTAAQWLWNAAMDANPIGLIIIAVAALIGWLVYLYYNWDNVQKKMQSVGDTTLFILALFVPVIGIPLLMAKHWTLFKSIFTNIWEGIKSYFNGAVMWLQLKIYKIRDFFVGVFTAIKNAWNSFMGMLKNDFPWLYNMFEGLGKVIESVGKWISHIWDSIVGFFKDISDWVGKLLGWTDEATNKFKEGGKSFEQHQQDELDKYRGKTNTMIVNSASTIPVTTGGGFSDEDIARRNQPPVKHNNFYGNINVQNPKSFEDIMKEAADHADRAGKKPVNK